MKAFAPPSMSRRFVPVWRRNLLVWRKLAGASILGNLADPLIYVLGLGYGLGSMLPEVGGVPYIAFLAAGMVCSSTMNAATFEAMYSAFSRMHVQRTWDAIMMAPLELDDVVLAELVWAASKSLLSGAAILAVIWLLGLSHSPLSLWVLALVPVVGLVFGALALVTTALAKSYDFFRDGEFFEPTGNVSKSKLRTVTKVLQSLGDLPEYIDLDKLFLTGVTKVVD